MSIFNTTIEINNVEDVPIAITYTAVPFCRGTTDGRHGPKIEPDEPAHIEIEFCELVNDDDGIFWTGKKREIELSEAQQKRITREIGEFLADQEADYREYERDY